MSSLVINYTAGVTNAVTRALQSKVGDLLDIKDFGAMCDGITDDAAAFNTAINAAAATGQTLSFPAGVTVLLASANGVGGNNTACASVGGRGASTLKIQGNGATLIDTNNPPLASGSYGNHFTINMAYQWATVIYEDLNFVSQHAITTGATFAISPRATSIDSYERFTVRNCTFRDHCSGLSIGNVSTTSKIRILNCDFWQQNRDVATLAGTPTQGININSLGEVEVAGCTYNGCTGTPGSSGIGDGLLIGYASGWQVFANSIRHFNFEGIFCRNALQASDNSPNTVYYPTSIYDNHIDATIPAGMPTVYPNGSPAYSGSYSIRSDAQGTSIYNNKLKSTTQGITCNPPAGGYPTTYLGYLHLHDNDIQMADTITLTTSGAIYGISVVNALFPRIELNQIVWNGNHNNAGQAAITAISCSGGTQATILCNIIDGGSLSTVSALTGIYLAALTGPSYFDGNQLSNMEIGLTESFDSTPVLMGKMPFMINVTTPMPRSPIAAALTRCRLPGRRAIQLPVGIGCIRKPAVMALLRSATAIVPKRSRSMLRPATTRHRRRLPCSTMDTPLTPSILSSIRFRFPTAESMTRSVIWTCTSFPTAIPVR